MHIRCPHCRNPIEVAERDSLSDVTCPSCGSDFSLIGDDATQTHHVKGASCQASSRPPPTVAHFQLLEQLGLGAFGAVWKARDTVLQRTVALKIPRRGQVTAEEAEYFFRDARAAAQLTHPHIVSVYEVGRDGDTIFIASKFIEGATLADWIESNPLMPTEAAALMAKVAEAIQHAHEHGVIHRDLKPGNILMDLDGEPHVADFGLAKRDSGEITMTVDGQVLGTPAYMSPEQARGHGHQADARSDVYSLGVILFQLLSGELPFRGSKAMLVVQILDEEPPSPRKFNSRVPRDLETVALKCLQKAPEHRYTTARDLAEDLARYVRGKPISAKPISSFRHAMRWWGRHATQIAAGYIFLLALQIGCAMLIVMTLSVLSAGRVFNAANARDVMTDLVRLGRDLVAVGFAVTIVVLAALGVLRGSAFMLIALDSLFALSLLALSYMWWSAPGFERQFVLGYFLAVAASAVLLITGAIISRVKGLDRQGKVEDVTAKMNGARKQRPS